MYKFDNQLPKKQLIGKKEEFFILNIQAFM